MEINRPKTDPSNSDSNEPRLGKSNFEKPRGEETDRSVDEQVKRLREALRSIGGCCNDTECLGAM